MIQYYQVEDAILAFVIGNQQSIKDIRKIYKDIKEFRENDVPYNIAVNNSDLREENRKNLVPVEEYSKLELKRKVFETSAKAGEKVSDVFEYIAK